MKCVHFFQSVLGLPMVESNTIGRKKNAGAIAAEPTVNEYFPFGPLGNKREEFGHLFVGRRTPTIARKEDKFHTERFGFSPFVGTFAAKFTAKIDNHGDAEFLQRVQTFIGWLCAAIKIRVEFSGILHAVNMNFFRELRMLFRNRNGLGELRRTKRGKAEEK